MNKQIIFRVFFCFFTLSMSGQCWKSISLGLNHAKGIDNDGILWSWGSNRFGQLGNGTTDATNNNFIISTPLKIDNDNDWKAVFSGRSHTIAIKNNGTLWGWGANDNGGLGDGTFINRSIPIQIGLDTNWKNLFMADRSMKAIKSDGSLWAWGYNAYGQLGDGTFLDKASPTRIGLDTDWQIISTGNSWHTLALKNNGSLWGWGANESGQLGDDTFEDKNIPVQIGSDTNWKSVFAGFGFSIGLKNDGTLWSWGSNDVGQLGNGTTDSQYIPTQIGISNDWKNISVGFLHVLAIKNDGSLWSWGYNTDGELGDGTQINKLIPTQIGIDNDWKNITTSFNQSYAQKNDNSFWGWGYNGLGLLGDGTTISKYIPTKISCYESLTVSDDREFTNQIYPNPAKDYFLIKNKEIRLVELYSLEGKLLKKYKAMDKYSINGLAKGIYIIKAQLENGKVISEKIIKE